MYIITSTNYCSCAVDEYVSAVNVFLAQETTLSPIEIQMYTGQVHSMDLLPSFSFKFSWLPIIIVCCFKVKHCGFFFFFFTFALNMHRIYLTIDVFFFKLRTVGIIECGMERLCESRGGQSIIDFHAVNAALWTS